MVPCLSPSRPWHLALAALFTWCFLFLMVMWDLRRDGPSAALYRYVYFDKYVSMDGHVNCTNPIVPPTVHWVWFHETPAPFRFHQYLSALSVIQHAERNTRIHFWYNTEPVGVWWGELRYQLRNTSIMFLPTRMNPPTEVYGNKVSMPEHQADVVKLEKLLAHGGLVVDFDVIIVTSLRPLMCYPATLGMEREGRLCAGLVMAAQNSPFIKLWLDSYRSFDDRDWAGHAVKLPYKLWRTHPHMLHVESTSLQHPNWEQHELPYLYGRGMYWDFLHRNYAVHLWYRFYNIDHDPDSIRTLDSTVGQLFRRVYYGDTKLLPPAPGSNSNRKAVLDPYMRF